MVHGDLKLMACNIELQLNAAGRMTERRACCKKYEANEKEKDYSQHSNLPPDAI
jgi:hypothetical protein